MTQYNDTIIIKKYPNRRLYNTNTSTYITLLDLVELIKQNVNVKVVDSNTDEDITSVTLIQAILEQQQKGTSQLIPEQILMQILKYHNNGISNVFFIKYLSLCMSYFESATKHIHDMSVESKTFVSPLDLMQQNAVYFMQHGGTFSQAIVQLMQEYFSHCFASDCPSSDTKDT